jgi:cytochrome bd-type quinol oxidase subunit 2
MKKDDMNNQGQSESSTAVIVAKWSFVTLGLIWLVFGIWSLIRMTNGGGNLSSTVLWIIAVLMFVNAAVLILVGWGLKEGKKSLFYFAILVLMGNIFLTFTDEFGVFDLITLIINIAIFIILLVTRKTYISQPID